MFEFATPYWLLLLPLPYLLWQFTAHTKKPASISPRHHAVAAIRHSQAELLIQLANASHKKARLPWLWILGCALLFIAAARPQWLYNDEPVKRPAHDMMLAVDISGSMLAQDFIHENDLTSRIDISKIMAQQFIKQRDGDRVGLIAFADDAFVFMPLTTDLIMAHDFLDEIHNGLAGERTALGDAIALAADHMRERSAKSRILILLTDGSHTTGHVSPESAILLAQQYQLRIYTIGVGTNSMVAFPRGPKQQPLYTELPLDETLLQRIATETGGRYFHANDTQTLQAIFNDIDQLEPTNIDDPTLIPRDEWFWLPLLLALSLLLLNERNTRQQVLP
ncbi:MAG: VWA domain-containing protein [Gammaproteobacteria bacterium]|nr:VWA domain-containing protein [Gammaproteobacteria bacterium]